MIALAPPALAQSAPRAVDPVWGDRMAGPYLVRSKAERLRDAAAATPRNALMLEALGGAVGSAAGMGSVLLASDCGVDDLGCDIISVVTAGAAGALGATLGTAVVARRTGTEHSVAGAAVGAILGTAVGLGMDYLVNRNSDRNLGDTVVLPIFAVSQGFFAAVGGRW